MYIFTPIIRYKSLQISYKTIFNKKTYVYNCILFGSGWDLPAQCPWGKALKLISFPHVYSFLYITHSERGGGYWHVRCWLTP